MPGGTFLVIAGRDDWRLAEWSDASSGPLLTLAGPGLLSPLRLPVTLALPRISETSLGALAARLGVSAGVDAVFAGPATHPSPPRGIDGSRQNPGSRPAPVLDPGAGVIDCSACAGLGVAATPCSCGPVAHEARIPCVLCSGNRSVLRECDVCGGSGNFLWPATLTVRRQDGLSDLEGDGTIAIDVDLTTCDVLIERTMRSTQGSFTWEDRWVVDLHRPFVRGCRDLGVEWPDAVVWVGEAPTVAARVSTAFTLLRMGTPTPRELSLQPLLEQWLVREGPVSVPEVLDPEHLGLHAAAIVARISRGAVVVSPLPTNAVLLGECLGLLEVSGLKAGLTLSGGTKVLVALSPELVPRGVIATGGSVAELLLNAKDALSRGS